MCTILIYLGLKRAVVKYIYIYSRELSSGALKL